MKKIIFLILAATFTFTACNTKQAKESTDNAVEQSDQLYACPMHPDITGNKGDKCSKCGMELTEPVKATPEETSATTESADSLSSNQ
jgi:hypothetical protein